MHPCAYQEVCDTAPGSTLLRWLDHRRSVVLLSSGTAHDFRQLLASMQEVFRATVLAREDLQGVVVVPDLGWTDPTSFEGLAEKSRVLVVPPITVQMGHESCRIVAPDRRCLRAFTDGLRRTGPVELLSVSVQGAIGGIREFSEPSAHLIQGMTDTQVRCLVAAWDAGLFEVPARDRWGTVSAKLHIARSTFGEHLRKGQRRLLGNSVAVLRGRAARAPGPVVLPQTGNESPHGKSPLRGIREESN